MRDRRRARDHLRRPRRRRRRRRRASTAGASTSRARSPANASSPSSNTSRAIGPTAWARLRRIEAPSPERRPPACARVRRLRRLRPPAPRLRRAARLETATRRATPSPRTRARRVSRLTPACPRRAPLGYRNKSKLVAREHRRRPRLVLGRLRPALARRRRSRGLPDRRAAARRDARPRCAQSSTKRGVASVRRANARPATCATSCCAPTMPGEVLAVWIAARPTAPRRAALARRLRAARPEVVGVVEHVNRTRGNAIFSEAGDERPNPRRRGTLEDRIEVDGRALRLRFRRAPSSRPTATSPRWPMPRSRAGSTCVRPSALSTPTRGVGGIALALAPQRRRGHRHRVARRRAVADATASAALNGDHQRPLRRRRRRCAR